MPGLPDGVGEDCLTWKSPSLFTLNSIQNFGIERNVFKSKTL